MPDTARKLNVTLDNICQIENKCGIRKEGDGCLNNEKENNKKGID
jgi:hypothetical protein